MDEIKIGDIILIDRLNSQGTYIPRHSFVVIDDENGKICSLDYDFIALLMLSFKSEMQKEKKLKFPGNFPITPNDEFVSGGHAKEGFIKAEQFYYFNKDKINYRVIGELKKDTLSELFNFINTLSTKKVKISQITDNL